MIIIGAGLVEGYLANARVHDKTLRSHYRSWLLIVGQAQWRSSEDIKRTYPKVSILRRDLVAFGIKQGNYVLIGRVHYAAHIFAIQFFGTAAEYERFKEGSIDGRSANLN
jgi:mRNA-degrading endonuclease HigB of HigAB toxin-antitoxin module